LILLGHTHYWESVAEHWVKQRPHRLWRIHSDSVNTMLFSKWLGNTRVKSILKTDLFDEAFGPGLYSCLSKPSENFIGIDISYGVSHAAQTSHGDLMAVTADARCLPFGDGSFDVVISNSSLDHFPTQDQIVTGLREIYRVLKYHGRLLITLDNPVNPVVALRHAIPFSFLNRIGVVPYYVGATYGPWKFRRVLDSVGFKVTKLDAVLHCPRALAVLFAHFVEKKAGSGEKSAFLRALMIFEHLSRLPTKFLTGYFVAANARKE